MPIYEFYCADCNTIFSFFARSVNTTKRPPCPVCDRPHLERQVSVFATTGNACEPGPENDLPVDEAGMERAMEMVASEAEGINEDDPKQAARLMRKFSDASGLQFGSAMEEALGRLESGEDPDSIERDMGSLLDGEEEPFVLPGGGTRDASPKRAAPKRDETLYDL